MLMRGHASSADAFLTVARDSFEALGTTGSMTASIEPGNAHALHGHSRGLAFTVEYASARLVVGF